MANVRQIETVTAVVDSKLVKYCDAEFESVWTAHQIIWDVLVAFQA